MADETNLAFKLGATWQIEFSTTDVDGSELDLSGGTVKFRVKRRGVRVLELVTPTSEISLNSPPDGTGVITVSPADQAGLVAAVYEHELRVYLADERVTTQAFGALTVAQSLF